MSIRYTSLYTKTNKIFKKICKAQNVLLRLLLYKKLTNPKQTQCYRVCDMSKTTVNYYSTYDAMRLIL